MRFILGLILFSLSHAALAQKVLLPILQEFPSSPIQVSEYSNNADYLSAFKQANKQVSFKLVAQKEGIKSTHKRYQVYYKDQLIVNAFFNLHEYNGKKVERYSLPTNFSNSDSKQDCWILLKDGSLASAKIDSLLASDGVKYYTYTTKQATYETVNGVFHNRAAASAYVFQPDPVTSALTSYGGDYIDNDDSSSAELDTERIMVNLDVTDDNGTLILENNYVKITEHSQPTVAPVTSTDGTFLYDRSQSGFEDVNILYHITTFQNYVQQLGFTSLGNYQLAVDAHGFFGQDQSAFQWNPEQLTFGEGGVDDGEDADVITHEYGHALSYDAAPGSNTGTERRALDEAIGDYFAASYSRLLNEHEWYKVFNWDGHNEFWDGRLAISDGKYPTDLANDLYEDAPLWSASLMEVQNNIGRDETHQILFESMYQWFNNMTMTDAANLFIEADSSLNNGVNYPYIGYVFLERGFIDTVYANRPPDFVLSSKEPIEVRHFKIESSNPLTAGMPLKINCTKAGFLTCYNVQGKLVYSSEIAEGMNTIPVTFKPGVILLRMQSDTGAPDTQKILILP